MSRNAPHQVTRLADVDLSARLARKAYLQKLEALQHRLTLIQQAYLIRGHKGVVVFEGWDAAGKGGTIRRMSAVLDPRNFKVWPIGAPRPYYLDRHYLLRFMERLPPRGALSVFDRSWYGRVLVERIESLTPEARWRQGFREINEFERMMQDDGTRIAKVFFHIAPEEQLARLEARLLDPLKRWKLSFEDFRNRRRWDAYAEAIDEMLAETSTPGAPWRVISSNHKRHGRIAALTEVVDRLGAGIDLSPAELDEKLIAAARDHLEVPPALLADLRGRTE
jgi:polyphosphate kinase 2 (PPK2 family)